MSNKKNVQSLQSLVTLISLFSQMGTASLAFGQVPKQCRALPHDAAVSCAKISLESQLKYTADIVDWVVDPHAGNICGGYFLEPIMRTDEELQEEDSTRITADRTSLQVDGGLSRIEGNVYVEQAQRRLHADIADIYRDPQTMDITAIDLKGHVRVRVPGKLLAGDFAHMDLENNTGVINHAHYRMILNNDHKDVDDIRQLSGLNGWGHADKIDMLSPDLFELTHATYSNCPPTHLSWHLGADKISLNKKIGRATASNSWFYVADWPLLYLPYADFPLDDERHSGLLMPRLYQNNKSGIDITVPFYLNMAANYDATLLPRYISDRGFMYGAEFRYLDKYNRVTVLGNYLPDDQEFDEFLQNNGIPNAYNNNRGAIAVLEHTDFNDYWSADIDYTNVSDPYYFIDFHQRLLDAQTNQLLQRGRLDFNSEHVRAHVLAQQYQTLHPITGTPVADAYSRMPQVVLDVDYPEQFWNTHWNFHGSYDHFTWPTDIPKTSGTRLVAIPNVALPLDSDAGYLRPHISLIAREYDLHDGLVDQQNSTIPRVAVDGGLYYERDFVLSDHHLTQTLEPRLFYLYVPFENQSLIPTFDTSYATFNYDFIFRENRFNGDDRIGDANQVTLAMSSAIESAVTGQELIRASVGQIIYFSDRDVQLCTGEDCIDNVNNVGFTNNTNTLSPLVSKLDVHINNQWSTTATLTWDYENQEIATGYTNLHYEPEPNNIINLNYSFIRNGDTSPLTTGNLEQIGVSTAWEISPNWQILGALRYNVAQQYAQTYFVGAEYNSCCWSIRALGGRTLTNLNLSAEPQYDTVFSLQILLKELVALGPNSTSALLTSNIPGYHDHFDDLI